MYSAVKDCQNPKLKVKKDKKKTKPKIYKTQLKIRSKSVFEPDPEEKLKPTVICSNPFSRASRPLHVFTSESWLVRWIFCVLCDWLE